MINIAVVPRFPKHNGILIDADDRCVSVRFAMRGTMPIAAIKANVPAATMQPEVSPKNIR